MSIKITWRDGKTPMEIPITARQVVTSAMVTRARDHLAIDKGKKYARQHQTRLGRILRRLTKDAEARGLIVSVFGENSTEAPSLWGHNRLGLQLRFIDKSHMVVGNIAIYSGHNWIRGRVMVNNIGSVGSPVYPKNNDKSIRIGEVLDYALLNF